MSADRRRQGTPPGIETMRGGNQDTEQGKQDRDASGEVGKTGVQGEGATGDQPARSEKDEGETMFNLEARILKLEEQTRWMYHKMEEMMEIGKTNMEEGGAPRRHEDDGDEWQRWNGHWWIRVEQADLNSRQRRKISRGLRRMITREQSGMARLLRELRKGIKAEIEESNRRQLGAHSESDEPSRNDEMTTSSTHGRIQLALQ